MNDNDNKPYDPRPTWYLNKLQRDKIYTKNVMKQIKFVLNSKTDLDIIDKLNSVENKQGYIKKLIREDIKNSESNH